MNLLRLLDKALEERDIATAVIAWPEPGAEAVLAAVNPVFARAFGYRAETLSGRSIGTLLDRFTRVPDWRAFLGSVSGRQNLHLAGLVPQSNASPT